MDPQGAVSLWRCRLITGAAAAMLTCAPVRATEYIGLPLGEMVDLSDAVVIVRVTDAERDLVRVERALKGATPRTIHLIEHIDRFFSRPPDQKPLVNGATELIFLRKKGEDYAPLQSEFTRWPIRNGRLETPAHIAERDLP